MRKLFWMGLALFLFFWGNLCYSMGLRTRASANTSFLGVAIRARDHTQRGGVSVVGSERQTLTEKVPTLKEGLALQEQVRVFVATQPAAGRKRKGAASPVGTAIAPAQPAQPLRYNRALHTGFGDRLSVMLNVAAAAATMSRDVYVFWHGGTGTQKHHSVMSLDEVEKYVVWPKNLKVLPKDEFDRLFHSEKLAGKFDDILFTTDNNQSILLGISR
jgi:hypothetical protein